MIKIQGWGRKLLDLREKILKAQEKALTGVSPNFDFKTRKIKIKETRQTETHLQATGSIQIDQEEIRPRK